METFRSDDEEDLIHQHVLYFLRHHPSAASAHDIRRIRAGFYDIDGHQVEVEWQHHVEVGRPGNLVVVDGPMRQPFADYIAMSEANAEYDTQTVAFTSALHAVPKERRMTFDDSHQKYTRLEAMRVAKEQASIREKAADYTREGQQVPDELVKKYNRVIRQKLRRGNPLKREDPLPATVFTDENKDPGNNTEAPKQQQPYKTPEQVTRPLLSGLGATPGACGAMLASPEAGLLTLAAPPSSGVISAYAAMTHPALSVGMMPARGISLNSYVPSACQASPTLQQTPQIQRSWSGIGSAAHYRAVAAAAASSPQPVLTGSSLCTPAAPSAATGPMSPMQAMRTRSALPIGSPVASPMHLPQASIWMSPASAGTAHFFRQSQQAQVLQQ